MKLLFLYFYCLSIFLAVRATLVCDIDVASDVMYNNARSLPKNLFQFETFWSEQMIGFDSIKLDAYYCLDPKMWNKFRESFFTIRPKLERLLSSKELKDQAIKDLECYRDILGADLHYYLHNRLFEAALELVLNFPKDKILLGFCSTLAYNDRILNQKVSQLCPNNKVLKDGPFDAISQLLKDVSHKVCAPMGKLDEDVLLKKLGSPYAGQLTTILKSSKVLKTKHLTPLPTLFKLFDKI